MTVINPFDFFLGTERRNVSLVCDATLRDELQPFPPLLLPVPRLRVARHGVACTGWTINFLVALNQRLQHEVHLSHADGAWRPDE